MAMFLEGTVWQRECERLDMEQEKWKPTPEQLKALHTAAYFPEMEFYGGLKDKLRELYEQLKKL